MSIETYDASIEVYYPGASENSVVSQSPAAGWSQHTFINALHMLRVPLLSKSSNRDGQDMTFVGDGASFFVTQPLSFADADELHIVNSGTAETNRQHRLRQPNSFVIKRIVPSLHADTNDCLQLSVIVNELRILGFQPLCRARGVLDLLGAAWDDVPSNGRFWPRLLIEAATHGTLQEFLRNLGDGQPTIKMELTLDILDGLSAIHSVDIAHCDLKLENILVFEPDYEGKARGRKYQAKISDFGFAVIQNDYDKDFELRRPRLGTEPWNAPELMGYSDVKIADLALADMYSFGLLFARIFLNGDNPFSPRSAAEIMEMKNTDRNSNSSTVKDAVLTSFQLAKHLNDCDHALATSILGGSLLSQPHMRQSPMELARQLFRHCSCERSSVQTEGSYICSLMSTYVSHEESSGTPISIADASLIPELDTASPFHPLFLPNSAAKELVTDLLRLTDDSDQDEAFSYDVDGVVQHPAAEACYQLAVAAAEGVATTKSDSESMKWLQRAATFGASKAFAAAVNLTCAQQPCDADLKRIGQFAIAELKDALFSAMMNETSVTEQYLCTRLWSLYDKESYRRHCCSSDFQAFRSAMIQYCCVPLTKITPSTTSGFDNVDGIKLDGAHLIGDCDLAAFTLSARQLDCMNWVGYSGLSLLQIAAIEGNAELALILLNLGARIEEVGTSPGYTPLWLSCVNGHFNVAETLVENGANVSVKDKATERTIIHLLNRFSNQDEVLRILDLGLKSGLSLEEQDKDGNTPLLSTFVGWDFSNGLALKTLLAKGANALAQKKSSGFNAVAGVVRRLDTDLLSYLLKSSSLVAADRGAQDLQAKYEAFVALISYTDFYYRTLGGAKTCEKLQQVLQLIFDGNNAWATSTMSVGDVKFVPLLLACYRQRDDLAKALLTISQQVHGNLDVADESGMTSLHWCAERGSTDTAKRLLKAGADPLVYDKHGRSFVHVAATFSPVFLSELIDSLEDQQFPRASSYDAVDVRKLILSPTANEGRETAILICITEGTPEHLRLFEKLRELYQVDYDAHEFGQCDILTSTNGACRASLTAVLVYTGVLSNLTDIRQLEHVLKLNPKPRFLADTEGRTLLHYGAVGYFHAGLASNPAGYGTLRLLLRHYPGKASIETGDIEGITPIHVAAMAANVTALETFEVHLKDRKEPFNVNVCDIAGRTPLDVLGLFLLGVTKSGNRLLSKLYENKIKMTREKLRQLGAKNSVAVQPLLLGAPRV